MSHSITEASMSLYNAKGASRGNKSDSDLVELNDRPEGGTVLHQVSRVAHGAAPIVVLFRLRKVSPRKMIILCNFSSKEETERHRTRNGVTCQSFPPDNSRKMPLWKVLWLSYVLGNTKCEFYLWTWVGITVKQITSIRAPSRYWYYHLSWIRKGFLTENDKWRMKNLHCSNSPVSGSLVQSSCWFNRRQLPHTNTPNSGCLKK